MKYPVIFTVVFAIMIILSPEARSQVKVDVKGKVNREADNRANRATDRAIDAGFDKLEEGIKGIFKKKDKTTGKESSPEDDAKVSDAETNVPGKAEDSKTTKESSPVLSWAKYDFVPGDQVIFEDNLLDEENGEFPSRWDLLEGTVENASFGGENVIMFRGGHSKIIPYLKNPDKDYLPEVFTIEFDLYIPSHNDFQVLFYDDKNQNVTSIYSPLNIDDTEMHLSPASGRLPNNESIEKKWAHIAIAYTNGQMKAYVDETRLINIPHLGFDPMGITLHAYFASDNAIYYVKNFRIAEGGVKYYDRFLQDGKIVSNGIRFDVNKATLKPESMGVINEIYKMLSEHPDVKVSVEGHTDNDGDNDFNQTLSEQRAETVVNTLKKMGIDGSRMTAKGWGESKPVDSNATPEGKGNNRRVEFVKI